MSTTEIALVDIYGTGEPKKLTVHNVLNFEEESTAIRVDWIGASKDEEDCFWVRLCITDEFGDGQAIEFCNGSRVMADLGRALCEAASEVDRAQISDLDDFLNAAWRAEHDRRERDCDPLWRRLVRQ